MGEGVRNCRGERLGVFLWAVVTMVVELGSYSKVRYVSFFPSGDI